MAQKKLLFLYNPRAGKNKSHAPLFDALTVFSDAGYLISIHETHSQGDATRTVAKYGKYFDLVVAVGGDGTLNETVSGLMTMEEPPMLGYIPQGSTNDFAASLGIPTDPVEAASAIVRSQVRRLDVGQWNQRSFVYVASFGAFTKSSYSAPQAAKNALGHFAYILEGLLDLGSLRPYRVRIEADGEKLDGEYLFGAVCNSTSIGGLMRLDPEKVVLDDGKFEILLIPNPRTPLAAQSLLFNLVNQNYDSSGLVFRSVSHVHVETDQEVPWSLDGEYAESVPEVEIENRCRALNILL